MIIELVHKCFVSVLSMWDVFVCKKLNVLLYLVLFLNENRYNDQKFIYLYVTSSIIILKKISTPWDCGFKRICNCEIMNLLKTLINKKYLKVLFRNFL